MGMPITVYHCVLVDCVGRSKGLHGPEKLVKIETLNISWGYNLNKKSQRYSPGRHDRLHLVSKLPTYLAWYWLQSPLPIDLQVTTTLIWVVYYTIQRTKYLKRQDLIVLEAICRKQHKFQEREISCSIDLSHCECPLVISVDMPSDSRDKWWQLIWKEMYQIEWVYT